MGFGDVVDQLLDQHGLADAGAAEQADLAALGVRREQIDDLNAGDQDLGLGGLIDIGGSRRVYRPLLRGLDRAGLVDRLAHHVHDTSERFVAYRDGDRLAGVDYVLAAHQAFGRNPWLWCARCFRRDAARPRARAGCRGSGSRARSGSPATCRRTARRRRLPGPGAHGPWSPHRPRPPPAVFWSLQPRETYLPCFSFLHVSRMTIPLRRRR